MEFFIKLNTQSLCGGIGLAVTGTAGRYRVEHNMLSNMAGQLCHQPLGLQQAITIYLISQSVWFLQPNTTIIPKYISNQLKSFGKFTYFEQRSQKKCFKTKMNPDKKIIHSCHTTYTTA